MTRDTDDTYKKIAEAKEGGIVEILLHGDSLDGARLCDGRGVLKYLGHDEDFALDAPFGAGCGT